MSLALSKGLSLGIIMSSAMIKIPQIIVILRNKRAQVRINHLYGIFAVLIDLFLCRV